MGVPCPHMPPKPKVVGHIMWAFDFADQSEIAKITAAIAADSEASSRFQQLAAPDFGLRDEGLKRTPLLLRCRSCSEVEVPEVKLSDELYVTIYHLGNASVRREFTFEGPVEDLQKAVQALRDNQAFRAEAFTAMRGLMPLLSKHSDNPALSEKSEDFVVFSLTLDMDPQRLIDQRGKELAQLAHLEPRTLHPDRVKETLARQVPFYADELVLIEWDAAVLLNVKSSAVVALLEFENARLVSTRVVRDRVETLAGRCKSINTAWWIFGIFKALLPRGEVLLVAQHYMDITDLFLSLRTGLNVIGDEQLSDIHDRAERAFRLVEEEADISSSLEAVSHTVHPLDARAGERRAEIMELIIIALIVYEIVLASH